MVFVDPLLFIYTRSSVYCTVPPWRCSAVGHGDSRASRWHPRAPWLSATSSRVTQLETQLREARDATRRRDRGRVRANNTVTRLNKTYRSSHKHRDEKIVGRPAPRSVRVAVGRCIELARWTRCSPLGSPRPRTTPSHSAPGLNNTFDDPCTFVRRPHDPPPPQSTGYSCRPKGTERDRGQASQKYYPHVHHDVGTAFGAAAGAT